MPSPQSEALKSLYRHWSDSLAKNPTMPLDELRRLFDHWGDVTAEPGGVDYIEVDAGGVPALWAVPKGCAQDRVLQCTHGGGYVTGSMYSHRKVYGHFAKAIGCRALILDYRRAPEHVHPAPVDDATTAYRWLLDQGIEPGHIAFTGDSAGGGLAVTTLLRARERGLPMPAATMPLSPWLDMEATSPTFESNRERDALVQRDIVLVMAGTFLGEGGNRKDPLANPLLGDLKGLPPMLIQVGGDETLLDDSRNLADVARRAGVAVTLETEPHMQHVYHFLAGAAPEADDAIERLAAWVRPKLGLGEMSSREDARTTARRAG
ncbi:alpha/beta hydrolase [Vineibacter terrae]|uniref:Alpha/beta hydrolase n=1 Tax=Vineibacter terrae TaxID=2586908 RepID=A0A5C8PHZ0_9HYPH|nr:alpha/beta hydrolase [Vineibacter terrae]TXL72958.1 alpha/beta hydrolase [Vineibacter terrae]